ncbi:MAG: sensor histidine kinase [Acetobacterium sp.]
MNNEIHDPLSGEYSRRPRETSNIENHDTKLKFAALIIENKELTFQKEENRKLIAELIIAKNQAEVANAALKKLLRYNRNLIEVSPNALVTIAPDGIITDVNIATEKAIGLPRKKLIGTDFADYFTQPERAKAGYQQAFREGAVSDYELAFKHINGYTTPVSYNASAYKDESGKIIGVFGTANDLTELSMAIKELTVQKEKIDDLYNELEYRVIERTSQLESVNRELEALSYSISHDLKAPLRHMAGYVSLLVNKYSDMLPEEGRHYFDMISLSARNMGELIDGLLEFSRSGRIELKRKCLNMNEIVAELIQPLIEQELEPRIEFKIGPLPLIFGDSEMIKAVWSNLIENAVKFSSKKDVIKISIGVNENENDLVFYIKDNGVGFDMNYASKLFMVFQRLHSKEDYEGTGVGLATVQRIIARHGGKIWAESKVERGAIFYFSLPKRKESNSI